MMRAPKQSLDTVYRRALQRTEKSDTDEHPQERPRRAGCTCGLAWSTAAAFVLFALYFSFFVSQQRELDRLQHSHAELNRILAELKKSNPAACSAPAANGIAGTMASQQRQIDDLLHQLRSVSKKVAEHSTDTPQSELAAQQRAIETLKASWQRALLRHNQSVSEQHAFIGRHLEEVQTQLNTLASRVTRTIQDSAVMNERVQTAVELASTAVHTAQEVNQSARTYATEAAARQAMERYWAMQLKNDWAAYRVGGRILASSPTFEFAAPVASGLAGLFLTSASVPSNPVETVLQPTAEPGDCWPMTGSSGFVMVSLRQPVRPTQLVVEHIPPGLAHSFASAPRQLQVWAVTPTGESLSSVLGTEEEQYPDVTVQALADVEFSPQSYEPMRSFQLNTTLETRQVVVRILSNHGNSNYTCVYRLRVLGNAA